jgi:phosphoglycolate phosphatase-like HAD superfamily hydrolase
MFIFFWDIDGTLLHCGKDGTIALSRALEELYGIPGAFENTGVGRAMDSALVTGVMRRRGVSPDPVKLDRFKSRYAEILCRILSEDADKRVLPGVRELLCLTERAGHINALLTSNFRVGAEAKLSAVGLLKTADGHPRFAIGGYGDEPGEKWEVARGALRALEKQRKTKIDPRNVVVLGDGVYDIETARQCGFRSAAVATGRTPKETLAAAHPDMLFDTLREAQTIIQPRPSPFSDSAK